MTRSPAAYVLGSAELGPCRAFARQHHAPAARRRTREACWRTCVHVYRRPFGRGMLAAASRRTCEASVVADMLGHAEVTGGGCIQQQGQGMGLSSDASPLEISALPWFIPGCCILHVAQRGAGLLHAAQRWKHFRAQEIAMAEEQEEEEEAQGHGEAWKPWFVLYLFGFTW